MRAWGNVSADWSRPWELLSTGYSGSVKMGAGMHSTPSYNFEYSKVGFGNTNFGGLLHRNDFLWSQCETTQGSYSFIQSIEVAVDRCVELGMTPTLILEGINHTPSFYTDIKTAPAATLTAWTAFCSAVAAHFAGRCVHFEIDNEPDLQGITQAAYFSMCQAGYAGIKAGNPNAKVIAGVTSGPVNPWTDNFWTKPGLNASCDIIAYHIYAVINSSNTAFQSPETGWYIHQLRYPTVFSQMGVSSKQIYLSEAGWWDSNAHATAKGYAKWIALVRCMPNVVMYSHYNQYNDGTGTAAWGLFADGTETNKAQTNGWRDMAVHAHWATSASLYRFPDNCQFPTTPVLPQVIWDLVGVKFSNGTTQRVSIWNITNNMTIRVGITASAAGTLKIQTAASTTATTSLRAGQNVVSLDVTDTPKILYSDDITTLTFQNFT